MASHYHRPAGLGPNMFDGLLSAPRHNEFPPSEQPWPSHYTKPKDRIRNSKECQHDNKQLTVYQAKNDTHPACAQPNDGESQSYLSIDARKFASNCHCWRL